MAADNMQHGNDVKTRISDADGSAALEALLASGSSRAKDNATKALSMMNDAAPKTPSAIPPTSPLDHVASSKTQINNHAIRVQAAGPLTYGA